MLASNLCGLLILLVGILTMVGLRGDALCHHSSITSGKVVNLTSNSLASNLLTKY